MPPEHKWRDVVWCGVVWCGVVWCGAATPPHSFIVVHPDAMTEVGWLKLHSTIAELPTNGCQHWKKTGSGKKQDLWGCYGILPRTIFKFESLDALWCTLDTSVIDFDILFSMIGLYIFVVCIW